MDGMMLATFATSISKNSFSKRNFSLNQPKYFRYNHEHVELSKALEMCYEMHEDRAHIEEDFHENESLLLTLGKLPQFLSDGNNPQRFLRHTVRLNAIKEGGVWYEIQKWSNDQNAWDQIHQLLGKVQRLSSYDFELLGIKELYDQSQDGDGLIFNPSENKIKLAYKSYEYPFVCTHKTEHRIGPKCPGIYAECNDKGICFNGKCECSDGYIDTICRNPCKLKTIQYFLLVGFENNCFQFSVELAPGQEFPCFEVDSDYSGGDISCQNDGSFPTAQSCLDKCRSVPSCIGFTWLGPDFTPSNGCCYKDTITRGSGLAGVVSGTIANCGP